jgi:hypothetical protein
MEYRAYLRIPGMRFRDEHLWEPFIKALEQDYAELGPVIGFSDEGAEVIVSMDCESEASAATQGVEAVTMCLQAVGLSELYPRGVEVEPAADDELAPA